MAQKPPSCSPSGDSSSPTFKVPSKLVSTELVIKKSRFIAWAVPVESREAALQWLAKARQQYPDARHHCWAYLLGSSAMATHAAANDDGEPKGTAGKPILNVIQHKGIGNVMVIVIRYFGGIKLGAGGLVRAYAGATEAVLGQTPLIEIRPQTHCEVDCDFADEQILRHFLEQHQGVIEEVTYHQGVRLKVTVEEPVVEQLEALCASLSASIRMR